MQHLSVSFDYQQIKAFDTNQDKEALTTTEELLSYAQQFAITSLKGFRYKLFSISIIDGQVIAMLKHAENLAYITANGDISMVAQKH